MFNFIKLTLSSNDKPTMVRVNAIVQMYEDTSSDGKECTRIEFENDYTKVREPLLTVMALIRSTQLNSIYGLTGGFTHARWPIYTDTDSIKESEVQDEENRSNV